MINVENEANKISLLNKKVARGFERTANESIREYSERILKKLNLRVEIKEGDREVINSGDYDLVMANHPCSLDLLFLTFLFGNEKTAFVVQNKRSLVLKKIFGSKFILPVPVSKETEQDFLRELNMLLKNNFRIVLFPTGGIEIKEAYPRISFFSQRIFGSEILMRRKLLSLKIDPLVGVKIQKQIGNTLQGIEILPEIHYTVSQKEISIPIKVNDIIVNNGEKEIFDNIL